MNSEAKPAQNALDKLLLKALGLESEALLTPTQSVEDGLEAFFKCKTKNFDSYISFDFVENSYWNPEKQDDDKFWEWEVGIRGTWFQDSNLNLCLTKALLWAVTELTEEEAEQLFKRKGDSNETIKND